MSHIVAEKRGDTLDRKTRGAGGDVWLARERKNYKRKKKKDYCEKGKYGNRPGPGARGAGACAALFCTLNGLVTLKA